VIRAESRKSAKIKGLQKTKRDICSLATPDLFESCSMLGARLARNIYTARNERMQMHAVS